MPALVNAVTRVLTIIPSSHGKGKMCELQHWNSLLRVITQIFKKINSLRIQWQVSQLAYL